MLALHTRESAAKTHEDRGSPVRYLGAGGTFRLEPPRLRTADSAREERHATWFELFFDLVFAAALAVLAGSLARDPAAVVFARFLGLFITVVWAWVLFTLYSNRFDTDDLIFRLAKSGAMLAIAAAAVELRLVVEGHGGAAGFAIAYVVLRGLLIALYVRAMLDTTGAARQLSKVYIAGYAATTGLWLASVFVSGPARFGLWAAAMVIDLIIPVRAWATIKEHAVAVSHLTERFGTFFIIILGQSILAAVTGVEGSEATFSSWAVAGLCLLVALCLWWIYFDLADTSVVGRGVLGLIYVYSHFVLLAGVALFGVGSKLAIEQATHEHLSPAARWASAGGIGAFALSLAAVHLGAEWTSMRDRAFAGRIALALLGLILAVTGVLETPTLFVSVLAGGVIGQLLLEAFTPRAGAASIVQIDAAGPPLAASEASGVRR